MAEETARTALLGGGGGEETAPVLGNAGSFLNRVTSRQARSRSSLTSLGFWRRVTDLVTVAVCTAGFGISALVLMNKSSASVCRLPPNANLLHVALYVFPWLAFFYMVFLSDTIRGCVEGGPSRVLAVVQLVVGVLACLWIQVCSGGLVGAGFLIIGVLLAAAAVTFCFVRGEEIAA